MRGRALRHAAASLPRVGGFNGALGFVGVLLAFAAAMYGVDIHGGAATADTAEKSAPISRGPAVTQTSAQRSGMIARIAA